MEVNKAEPLLKRLMWGIAKTILYIVLFIAGGKLFVFWVDHSLNPVDANNLPATFPVFATWHDGQHEVCQVFFAQAIAQLKEAHPNASLNVPHPQACRDAIEFHEKNGGRWPVHFEWQVETTWPQIEYSLNKESDGSIAVALSYRQDDDDYNRSRYRLHDGKVIDPRFKLAYGPGIAIAAMLSGLGLVLGGYIASLIYRSVRRRRERARQAQRREAAEFSTH